ncbi:unnamed protein product, partial [Mesorhabditis belari]|uniref:Uncharacterized protein n=1 Tax=Mesorhabditis belari TaxID=2138241 RepID=A0AAF3FMI7_9BILA
MKMFVMAAAECSSSKGENGTKIPPHSPDIPKDFLGVFKVKHEIDADIVDVSTGLSHSALLTNKQHIYTWGRHRNKLERNEPQKLLTPKMLGLMCNVIKDLPSLAAAFVHMLGGEFVSAVNTVKQVIDNRNGVMTDQDDEFLHVRSVMGGNSWRDGPSTTLFQHALLHLPKPTDRRNSKRIETNLADAWSNRDAKRIDGDGEAKMLSKWTPSSSQLTTNVHCGECIREWLEIVKGNQGDDQQIIYRTKGIRRDNQQSLHPINGIKERQSTHHCTA